MSTTSTRESQLKLVQDASASKASLINPCLQDAGIPTASDDSAEAQHLSKSLFPYLTTTQLGRQVLFASSLSSTQTTLQELRGKCKKEIPLVCFTTEQTAGRGRGNNVWSSHEGCLTFSFQSSFTDGNSLPFVQYLVSLAVVQSAKELNAEVSIKWPNDIYVQNMKVGGILCQSEYSQSEFQVTTGIGINISNPKPTTCLNDIISNSNHEIVSKERFLAKFCNVYEKMEKEFKISGFQPFVQAYTESWLHQNQSVTVKGEKGEPDMTATITGLTSTGCLLAFGDNGQRYELYPDGNSFDFFSGLLKRKL